MSETSIQRLAQITLDENSMVSRNADIEHERAVAIYDLLEKNHFAPAGFTGPYHLHIGTEDDRLVFDIRDTKDKPLEKVMLPFRLFRQTVKDYFMHCESYYSAIKTASPARIESLDMSRRGIHDEGSELLRERLKEKVDIDFDTARRLFTLICVLHMRG